MGAEIKLSAEIAENLVECLESRIAACDLDLKACDEGREKILQKKAQMVETLAATRSAIAAVQTTASPNGKPRERRPKGHGESLIAEVLAAHPDGLTIGDIERKTTVNHATVFRTLKNPKRNKGRFVSQDGKIWKLNAT